uniref:Ion transport domain-containing protein n=1 Tax=Pseudonaja textilis TaxID=8673 RepID=A0A670ZRL3_PSETE
MYDRILMKGAKMDPPSKLEVIKNGEQLTPLTLAVKTGKILRHMLQRDMKERKFHHLSRKLIEWTYGPIQSSLYDLTSIDSCEENSMMETLAYNSDVPNRYEMLALEPLNKLLQHKWESFIRKRFLISFFFHLIFMTIFTVTAYNWSPKDEVTTLLLKKWMVLDLLRLLGAAVILIGGIYFFVAQPPYVLPNDRCFSVSLSGPSRFVQALAILASSVMFFANTEKYVLPMVFALLLGWMNMLYYTRGCQQTGICLIISVCKFWYLQLITVRLVTVQSYNGAGKKGLTTIFHTCDCSTRCQNNRAVYSGLLRTALLLFRFTIGMGDLEYNENLKHSYTAMLLVLLFVILTYILLLNMLIALMSETVTDVSKYSQSVWQLQVRPRDWDSGHSWPSRGLNGTRSKEPAGEKMYSSGFSCGVLGKTQLRQYQGPHSSPLPSSSFSSSSSSFSPTPFLLSLMTLPS